MKVIPIRPPRKNDPVKKERPGVLDSMSGHPVYSELMRAQAANPLDTLDYTQCTRVITDEANGANDDRIEYSPLLEAQMTNVACGHFCFPRIPATWAELHSFTSYASNLWSAAGGGHLPKYVKYVQECARIVDMRIQPWRVPAFDAYIAGNKAELLRIHTDEKTLETIAADWEEFPEPGPYEARDEELGIEPPTQQKQPAERAAVIPFPRPLIARRARAASTASENPLPVQVTGNPHIQANAANPLDSLDFSLSKRIFANGISPANDDRMEYRGSLFLNLCAAAGGLFCFPRQPNTWAELNGFFKYCQFLWTAAGGGQAPNKAKKIQEFSRRQALRNQRHHVPALDAFIAGDFQELLRIHTEDGTLEYLADSWHEEPSADASEAAVIPDYSFSANKNVFARMAFDASQTYWGKNIDYAHCLRAVEQLIGKGDDSDQLKYPKSVEPFMRKRIMRGHGFGRLPANRAELNAFVHYAFMVRELDASDKKVQRRWVRSMTQD